MDFILILVTLGAVFSEVISMNVPINEILTKKAHTSCVRSCREVKPKYGVEDYTCGFSCFKIRGKLMRRRQKRDTGDDAQKKRKSYVHITPLPKLFNFYDIDGDKEITLPEFARSLGHNPRKFHVRVAFSAVDKNDDGKIDMDEFPNDVWVFDGDGMFEDDDDYNIDDTILKNAKYDDDDDYDSDEDKNSSDDDDDSKDSDDVGSDSDSKSDSSDSEDDSSDETSENSKDSDDNDTDDSRDVPDIVADSIEKIGDTIKDAFDDSAPPAINVNGLDDGLEDVIDNMAESVENMGENFGNVMDGEIGDIVDNAGDAVSDVTEAAGEIMEGAGEAAGDVISNIGDVTGDVVDNMADATSDVMDNVGEAAGNVVENLAETASDVMGNVGEAAGNVVENVADTASDVMGNVGEAAGNVVENVADTTTDVMGNVGEVAADVVDNVADTAGNILGDSSSEMVNGLAALNVLKAAPPTVVPKTVFEVNNAVKSPTINENAMMNMPVLPMPIETLLPTAPVPGVPSYKVPSGAGVPTNQQIASHQGAPGDQQININAWNHMKSSSEVYNDIGTIVPGGSVGNGRTRLTQMATDDSIQWRF